MCRRWHLWHGDVPQEGSSAAVQPMLEWLRISKLDLGCCAGAGIMVHGNSFHCEWQPAGHLKLECGRFAGAGIFGVEMFLMEEGKPLVNSGWNLLTKSRLWLQCRHWHLWQENIPRGVWRAAVNRC